MEKKVSKEAFLLASTNPGSGRSAAREMERRIFGIGETRRREKSFDDLIRFQKREWVRENMLKIMAPDKEIQKEADPLFVSLCMERLGHQWRKKIKRFNELSPVEWFPITRLCPKSEMERFHRAR